MEQISEAELSSASRSGEVIGGGPGGTRRAMPAAWLRRCCQLRDQVDPRGIRLSGVTVTGQAFYGTTRFDDFAERAARRAALQARDDWKSFLTKVQPLIHTQHSRILLPTPFSPIS